MERFARLTEATMTPAQREAAAAIMSGPRGSMRGPFKALLQSPVLADRAQRLGAFVRFESSLPARLNELAILVVARHWTAQFEWYAHRELAEAAGLDPAIADAIALGRRPASMAADEAAIHDFALELLTTKQVSDATFARVRDLFGEAGVIDLVGALGYYTLVSMVLNVDRYELPEGVAPPLA